jgi:hypothetical protein
MTHTQHIRQLAEEYGITVIYHDGDTNQAIAFLTRPGRDISEWDDYDVGAFKLTQTGLIKANYFMWPKNTILVPPPWKSLNAYFSNLHEVGHIALRHTPSVYNRQTMKCEIDAWTWALENSLTEPTSRHLNEFKASLETYVGRQRQSDLWKINQWYRNQKK